MHAECAEYGLGYSGRFDVGQTGGRPHGTTQEAGYDVGGRPHGMTREAGYDVGQSGGRPQDYPRGWL